MNVASIFVIGALAGLLIYSSYLEASDPRPCLRWDLTIIYTGNGTMVPVEVCGEYGLAPVRVAD